MPTDTSDQQITMPSGTDSADNPVAFVNEVSDVEPRLVRLYTNLADRTARMSTLLENNISGLAAEDRLDVYDGANHISLHSRALFSNAFRTTDSAPKVSDTALGNDTVLAISVPAAGRFNFTGTLFYDTSTTADIKFAFTIPAGATIRWGGLGLSTAGGGALQSATAIASGSAIAFGGAGVGTANTQIIHISGSMLMGGTAGILWLQWAQNTSDATNTILRADSRIEVWRVA
jgi:hypothetical protein